MAKPDEVVIAYPPAFARHTWAAVSGGFSGAAVWKGTAPDGPAVALKRWPSDYPTGRLRTIHRWMQLASPLSFVPQVISTRTGETVVERDGTLWDLTTWMPGEPDRHPTDARVSAACSALAELHRIWFNSPYPNPPPQGGREQAGIPAVHRRLDLFQSYRSWQAGGGRPAITSHARLNRKCDEAFALLPAVIPELEAALSKWRDRPLRTFPCLCDVHAGHVLFTGDAVTGVIDYGAMKIDHPAVDLARYLGAAVTGDTRAFAVGLAAYRAANPPVDVTDDLVYLLEVTGAAGGLANWLLRLAAGHPVDDPQNVARRMKRMLARLRLAAGPGSH